MHNKDDTTATASCTKTTSRNVYNSVAWRELSSIIKASQQQYIIAYKKRERIGDDICMIEITSIYAAYM